MKSLPCFGGILLASVLSAFTANGQVVLNEALADNRSAVENGSDFPDYIELYNPTGAAISLAGMSLTDDPAQPRLFVFPAGSSIPAGGYFVVWCDNSLISPGLHTGFGLAIKGDRARLYAADGVTLLDEIAFGLQLPDLSLGRVSNGSGAWTLTRPTPGAANVGEPLGDTSQLRLNEWMARPTVGEDWIEVYNGATRPVALSGLVITDRPSGSPTNRAIANFSFIASRGFLQFFASDLIKPDADHLDFKIGSTGETLTLHAANRSTVLDQVIFGTQTQDVSQGRAPNGSDNIVFFPANRVTPGEGNYQELTSVVISEVLTHTDPPLEDAIELHNPTATAVNIGYWWLSDAAADPKKYQIPAGTLIPAGGYRVFYQYQFDAGAIPFSLNSFEGDDVLLSVGDAAGTLTGPQISLSFGALVNGVSVGRYQTSVGVDVVPLSARTFGVDNPVSLAHFRQGNGLPNAASRIGPVVISEFFYRPPDVGGQGNSDDEFIELHNPTPASAPLFHPVHPTNTWRLREGITFNFPGNVTISSGGFLLVVSFNPQVDTAKLAAFRSKFSVPVDVPVLGPYSGKLNDTGEKLALLLPDTPQSPDSANPGFVPYMMAEQIQYTNAAPWPPINPTSGFSLHRPAALSYGNEPNNWVATAPSPGRPFSADSDGDGMPDAWEAANGLNPNSAADATQDPDGDGASNLAEYNAGTNPRSSASVFRIVRSQVTAGNMIIEFSATAGKTYNVLYRPAASSGAWTTLTSLTASTTGLLRVTNAISAAPQRFYRIAIP